ncbi:unnamed protein product (macronuclear) [Paramecium tetraurelia]|uniref:Uncharacterized protein n=1 Tax=Paramecium tetraurelia TaxID=5888 RepID=A0CE51_PARTE|nr:uncharacterized protein GSPATT00037504001 [Paramecium tetraurelia]CAK69068.1 unnamed protein product [Paramecium tetraurelia]|eukprot:XP_001436465.1 hypothetical protein (macronuclear) [Paramecium tetraurelia strain d4-2]
MKSTYLIKDVIYEKNQERQFQFHKNKLKEILTQPLQLNSEGIMQKLKHKHEQMKLTQQFQTQEQNIEKSRIDKNLMLKLLNNNNKSINGAQSTTRSINRNSKINMYLNTINNENKSLAIRIYSLPSVINSQRHQQEYQNHKSDLKIMQRFHKQKLYSNQDLMTQQIQTILGKGFEGSKYQNLNFLKQIGKQNKVLFLTPLQLRLFSKLSNNNNNPPHFQLKAFNESKYLGESKSLQLNDFLGSLFGIVVSQDVYTIKFTLYKIKQNEDFELGHFLFTESASPIKTKQLRENLQAQINDPIECYVKKEINNEQICVGLFEYQIIQFCYCVNKNPQIKKDNLLQPQYLIEVVQPSPQKSAQKSLSEMDKLQLD